jgi:phosphate starvation-inducible PhoH-like protein
VTKPTPDTDASGPLQMHLPDNKLAQELFGPHHSHLHALDAKLGVHVTARGNHVTIKGERARDAKALLDVFYSRLVNGGRLDSAEFERMVDKVVTAHNETQLRDALSLASGFADFAIKTRKKSILPRTENQAAYIHALRTHELVFGLGPAGTGKTFLAVARAVEMLVAGEVERLVLSRPAVEAGERLGFLPGDMKEKIDPYLRPLYDALHDTLGADQLAKRMEAGEIEIAPLAFMRGRTLAHAYVILDEGQNTTPVQMKMFLTRLGEGSRMVVTGDLSQVDLPAGQRSGLLDALETLTDTPGIAILQFDQSDVVRHRLVSAIVKAYDTRDARNRGRNR